MPHSQTSTLGQLKASITNPDLKSTEVELQGPGLAIKDEASVLTSTRVENEAEQNSKFRHFTGRLSSALANRIKAKRRMKWLDELNQFDYVTPGQPGRKFFGVDKTELFRKNKNYQKWRKADRSTRTFFTGIQDPRGRHVSRVGEL